MRYQFQPLTVKDPGHMLLSLAMHLGYYCALQHPFVITSVVLLIERVEHCSTLKCQITNR